MHSRAAGPPGRRPVTPQEARQQHRDLLAAIAARDSGRAQEIAEGHVAAARDIRLALWERSIL